MPSLATVISKNMPHRFFIAMMVLVLFVGVGISMPKVAAAKVNWGIAGDVLWENTVNLFTHPVDQVSRATSIAGEKIMVLIGDVLAKALEGISWVILQVAAFFLQSMAGIMDYAIGLTIQLNISKSEIVNVGWTAVRDISNMFFIFAILYIAIQTILGLAGGSAKRWLAHLIIAALLINFSLFITTVVVDAGNVLAVSFWSKMTVKQGSVTRQSAATKFLEGFNMQTILAKEKAQRGNDVVITPIAQAMINIGGTIFMFIAGYMFLAGALMMVTRTIMIALLMIFSPFAFLCFGLPKLEQYGHDWLGKLVKQTFVAPIFIFMLYLSSVVVDNANLFSNPNLLSPTAKGQTWSGVFNGETTAYVLIYNFVILIGFLVASLAIANKYAGDAGSSARGWAKSATKWAGGAAAGGAVAGGAWGMRQSLGKVGMMGKDNARLHELAAEKSLRGSLARGTLALSGGMARATYDPRATKYGSKILSGGGKIDIGQAGGKGGFEATGSGLSKVTLGAWGYTGTAHDKEVLEIAKQRYANDPKGREAYLRANLGTVSTRDAEGKLVGATTGEKLKSLVIGTSRYEKEGEFKGTRQEISRETATVEAKKNLRDNIKAYKEAQEKGELTKLNAEGKEVGKAAADVIKESLNKLNAKEAADALDNEQLRMAPVIAALNNQHLAGLNTRADLTPETITAITSGVVTNGTDRAQKYLRTQARMGSGQFQIDAEKELDRITKDYDAKKTEFESNANRTPEIEQKWKEDEKTMKAEAGKFLGMMEANEIAELDNALITHEAVMSGYETNSKVVQKIRERLNNNLYDNGVAAKLTPRFGKQAPPPQPSMQASTTTPPAQQPPQQPAPQIIIPPGSRTA